MHANTEEGKCRVQDTKVNAIALPVRVKIRKILVPHLGENVIREVSDGVGERFPRALRHPGRRCAE